MREREKSAGLFEVHLEMLDWRWPRFPAFSTSVSIGSFPSRFCSKVCQSVPGTFGTARGFFYPKPSSVFFFLIHAVPSSVFTVSVHCFAAGLSPWQRSTPPPPAPYSTIPSGTQADRQQKI